MKDIITNSRYSRFVAQTKSKWSDSSNMKGIAINKLYCEMIVLGFEMPTISCPETIWDTFNQIN